MGEKKNVLVFSGAPYPAIQICQSLKYNLLFNAIAASSYSNHSEFVFKECIDNLPFVQDPEFIECFCKLLIDRNIEFVIPTDDTIALELTKHQSQLSAAIVCSPYETAKLCRYKSLTYMALDGTFYLPRLYSAAQIDDITDYPLFIKPDDGQGARGTMIVNRLHDFNYVNNLENMVICEYLPGEEFTVDCFTDRFRKLLFCNPRCRARIINGITARGFNIPCSDEFLEIINDINSKIEFRGYWFVQLKRDLKGRLKLLELCTRFSGSFGISNALGVNLPLLALCDFAEMSTEILVNDCTVIADKTYCERYRLELDYRRLYIDYDDTVTCENGDAVNPYVIAFLYQCRSKGIEICLITRHAMAFNEPVRDSFKRLGISSRLFDRIIELPLDKNKTDMMDTSEKSIFLDNSFAERKLVHDSFNIPVYGVNNIDCLFDWR